ncbi:MAG: MBL fold metallo-hydrolase, partial [Anaerolineae bacterium]|nr:MBL fold metallo-hydrolase [Anaerolineae bacterium]
PSVGVITTPTQTVLIDAGNSPRHAHHILAAMREISLPPVTHIIYTHHHWDHTFGGQVWDGLVVGHEQTRELLRSQYISKPWSSLYIQEEINVNPQRRPVLRALDRAVDDWRAFKIALPEVTFSDSLELHLDGLTLDLRHVGGSHAPDSITIMVRQAGVLFVGDACYPPPPHLRKPEDVVDRRPLEAILEQEAVLYVEGHHEPATRDELARRH